MLNQVVKFIGILFLFSIFSIKCEENKLSKYDEVFLKLIIELISKAQSNESYAKKAYTRALILIKAEEAFQTCLINSALQEQNEDRIPKNCTNQYKEFGVLVGTKSTLMLIDDYTNALDTLKSYELSKKSNSSLVKKTVGIGLGLVGGIGLALFLSSPELFPDSQAAYYATKVRTVMRTTSNSIVKSTSLMVAQSKKTISSEIQSNILNSTMLEKINIGVRFGDCALDLANAYLRAIKSSEKARKDLEEALASRMNKKSFIERFQDAYKLK